MGDAVNDGVAITGLTGTPATLHPVVSGISLAADLNFFAELGSQLVVQPPKATPIDEEHRQNLIRRAFQKLSETLGKMRETEDEEDSWDCMVDFVLLAADTAALPLPTAIRSKDFEFEFAEGKKQNLVEDMKTTRKWVRSLLDENADSSYYNLLINQSKNLEKRWEIQNRFSRVVANYEGLSPNLPLEAADDKLSKMQADLEQIDRDGLIEFLPAVKVCAWLELAATRLCSDMKRDYSVTVSKELLNLQEELARQQQDNQMSEDLGGDDHVPTPHQLGHPGGDDGSLRIDETLDLDASVQAQNEQENQNESYEGQPPPRGKRKHGPAGLSPSTTLADSLYKRPRIGSSTGQAVVGEGKGGGRDDPNQLSSHLRQRKYPGDEGIKAMKGQSGDIRDDGQAQENKDEVQPDENRVEVQAWLLPTVCAPVGFALSREITYGEIRAAEIDEASKFASTILGEADQSLFSQYIERTRDANTVKDEGSIPCKGTYYHSMATLSLYTLYKTPITITTKRFPEDKYLTVNQVAEIIREVFVCIFPAMFQTLVEALAIAQKPYTSGSGASSPYQEDSIPQDVLKMKGILKELDNLKASTLQANMRELRLLIQLRMVYNAAVEPSVDINSIETTFQSTVTEIRQYAAKTHEQSMTIKAKSRQEFIKRYFPSQAKQLDAYLRKSHVLHAMVCTFSIGCLWMQPKPHARAWIGISSGLHTIFNIIRECDQEGRVYNICNSLGALTTAYTETESSINVDRALLDGMDEEPLQCIIRLIEEESGASRRVVEEYSPSLEEQGRCSSQPESGNACLR